MRTGYIISYDISDPKRLRKTFKLLKDWGDHVQLSVFYCELNRSELLTVRSRLGDIIDHSVDQVMFIDLGPAETRARGCIVTLGKPFATPPRGPVIV